VVVLTKTISITENQIDLSDLLAQMDDGAEVVLMEGNVPVGKVMRLKPVDKSRPRRANLFPNSMKMSDDFDEPLPDSFWLGEDE
jgi:antitoxin (DNA-binding transcriptional repressor) of toxin-antitoxin stability system